MQLTRNQRLPDLSILPALLCPPIQGWPTDGVLPKELCKHSSKSGVRQSTKAITLKIMHGFFRCSRRALPVSMQEGRRTRNFHSQGTEKTVHRCCRPFNSNSVPASGRLHHCKLGTNFPCAFRHSLRPRRSGHSPCRRNLGINAASIGAAPQTKLLWMICDFYFYVKSVFIAHAMNVCRAGFEPGC